MIVAILASAISPVIAAIISYNMMVVKVGLDKNHFLSGATKPLIITLFIVVRAVGLVVHVGVTSAAFND